MDISILLKIAGVGFLIAASCQILQKSGRGDIALLLSLCGIVTVLFLLMGRVGELFGEIRAGFGI